MTAETINVPLWAVTFLLGTLAFPLAYLGLGLLVGLMSRRETSDAHYTLDSPCFRKDQTDPDRPE